MLIVCTFVYRNLMTIFFHISQRVAIKDEGKMTFCFGNGAG